MVMNSPLQKVLIIAGPTASGKKKTAISIAERFNGEIVSADSRKVFRHLNIGTAKPSKTIREHIPYHIIDILEPDGDYSAGQFSADAQACLDEIISRGKLPIVSGGTGFYIKALKDGLSPAVDSWPENREKLIKEYKREGIEPLLKRLENLDPERARSIPKGNVRRIIRSLEIVEQTGFTFAELNQTVKEGSTCQFEFFYLCLRRERDVLKEHIRERTKEMFRQGLVEELRKVLSMGYERSLNSLNTVGYKELFDVIDGFKSEEDAMEDVIVHTSQYAKRQMTWFMAQPDVKWIDIPENEREYINKVFDIVKRFLTS